MIMSTVTLTSSFYRGEVVPADTYARAKSGVDNYIADLEERLSKASVETVAQLSDRSTLARLKTEAGYIDRVEDAAIALFDAGAGDWEGDYSTNGAGRLSGSFYEEIEDYEEKW
jgi:hypothetical protein